MQSYLYYEYAIKTKEQSQSRVSTYRVNNPLTKACGLSPHAAVQSMLYLSYGYNNIFWPVMAKPKSEPKMWLDFVDNPMGKLQWQHIYPTMLLHLWPCIYVHYPNVASLCTGDWNLFCKLLMKTSCWCTVERLRQFHWGSKTCFHGALKSIILELFIKMRPFANSPYAD